MNFSASVLFCPPVSGPVFSVCPTGLSLLAWFEGQNTFLHCSWMNCELWKCLCWDDSTINVVVIIIVAIVLML